MRSVEQQAHKNTSKSTCDGDGGDPSREKEANSLPVDCFEGTVAKTDANGSTCDAHRCRDGKGILRED